MNKYHLLHMIIGTLCCIQSIFSCPCMPSSQEDQPFFEQQNEQPEEHEENEAS